MKRLVNIHWKFGKRKQTNTYLIESELSDRTILDLLNNIKQKAEAPGDIIAELTRYADIKYISLRDLHLWI